MRTTISLDGIWRFRLDPGNDGATRGLPTHPELILGPGEDIRVPSVWEELHPGYDGVAWYAKEFDLPACPGGRVRLRFGAVNYRAEAWLNGRMIGAHEGGYTPFTFDATAAARPGLNRLVLRVLDVGRTPIDGLHLDNCPSGKEGAQGNFGGVWGSVEALVSGATALERCHVVPMPFRKQVELRALVVSPVAATVRLKAVARRWGGDDGTGFACVHEAAVAAGSSEVRWTVPFADFRWWSPDDPALYELDCTLLRDGRVEDACRERFGMRELTVSGSRFMLNGRQIDLKGVLHQGPYPLTIAYPEDEACARRELQLVKEANCNFVRLHLKPASPVVYRLADEMGVMLYDEPPLAWIPAVPNLAELCRREIAEMVERDFNHPSVVVWGVFNETGNPGFAKTGGCQAIRDDLALFCRGLDPARIVIDDSGSHEFTGRSTMLLPWSSDFTLTHDRHGYYRSPLTRKDYDRLRSMGQDGIALFRSEYGTGGMPDLPRVIADYDRRRPGFPSTKKLQFQELMDMLSSGFADHGLDRIFGDVAAFCRATQQVQADGVLYETQAMRMNPRIPGYIICQFADYPFETGGGLVDMWRQPKLAYRTFRLVNRPRQATLFADPVCAFPGAPLRYDLAAINEGEPMPAALVRVSLCDAAGTVLASHDLRLDLGREARPLEAPAISAPPTPGTYTLQAELIAPGLEETLTRTPITVLAPIDWRALPEVHVIDASGRLSAFLAGRGVRVVPFTGAEAAPLILVGDLEDLTPDLFDRLLAAWALARRGALVAILGIGNAKPMSPWYKSVTLDYHPGHFPERIKLLSAEGRVENTFHFVKRHPLFAGLPQDVVINLEYRNVYPANCLVDVNPDGEVIAGCFHMLPRRWGVDVMRVPEGAGAILYHQFQIIANLGRDPAAEVLLANVIAHAAATHRLATPEETAAERAARTAKAAAYRESVEAEARGWLVAGPFDNPGDNQGMTTVHPPEYDVHPDREYAGASGPVRWQRVVTTRRDEHLLDLPLHVPRERSVTYALSFFKSTVRKPGFIEVEGLNIAVWYNNGEVLRVNTFRSLAKHRAAIEIRRGWNKILVKSADFCYDGTINNTLRVAILDESGKPFPDLAWGLQDLLAAETEVKDLFLPPYLKKT